MQAFEKSPRKRSLIFTILKEEENANLFFNFLNSLQEFLLPLLERGVENDAIFEIFVGLLKFLEAEFQIR